MLLKDQPVYSRWRGRLVPTKFLEVWDILQKLAATLLLSPLAR